MSQMRLSRTNFCGICIAFIVFVACQTNTLWAYEKEIQELSTTMAENIGKSGKNRIAVVDFTDLQGNVTELGRFIAEEFAVALLGTGQKFEIIDRTHLQTLLKEHKLSSTGLIDPVTAQKLGEIAGVDALVTGTITALGESIRLSVKILDVKTAKLIGANVGNIPATEMIKTLLASEIQSEGMIPIETKVSKPQTPPQQTVETQGFTFILQDCKRSGDTIRCYFLVKSNEQDRELDIVCFLSRMLDEFGNEYGAIKMRIGNNTGTEYIRSFFVANVPTNSELHFENVSPQANLITLLEIMFSYP